MSSDIGYLILVFVAHIALVTIIGFSSTNLRSHYRSWTPTVDHAYRTHCVGARPTAVITVATGFPLPFPVVLKCGDLTP